MIARSIEKFGFTNPVLFGDDGQIIAGHGRVAAARLLGLGTVPAIALSHLSDADCRGYVLADNKLAEIAGWDRDILAIELQELIDLDFEVDLIGFSLAETDSILEDAKKRDVKGNDLAADHVPPWRVKASTGCLPTRRFRWPAILPFAPSSRPSRS